MSPPEPPSRDSQEAAEIRREATDPQGRRYTVLGVAKDWNLGTGSLLLDTAQFVWAFLRRLRGKEWVVTARLAESGASNVSKRRVTTREDALATVAELTDAVESGSLSGA